MTIRRKYPMNRLKRILALSGAVLLVCMYAAALVFALIDSPAAAGLFRASIAATILVPVLLYAYILAARILKGKGRGNDGTQDPDQDGHSNV